MSTGRNPEPPLSPPDDQPRRAWSDQELFERACDAANAANADYLAQLRRRPALNVDEALAVFARPERD